MPPSHALREPTNVIPIASASRARALTAGTLAAGWDHEQPTALAARPRSAAPPPARREPTPGAVRREVPPPRATPPVAARSAPVAAASVAVTPAAPAAPAAPVSTIASPPVPRVVGATALAIEPAPPPPAPSPAVSPAAADPFAGMWQAPAPVAAAAAVATPAQRWDVFVKLGLGPPAELSKKSAKWMVSTYRLLGFIVLTIIVVVLVGYLATTAFYFVSDSWVQPTVVSATDERVLALQSQRNEHVSARDRLAAQLKHADRAIAVEQTYQAEFAKAIRADLEGRTAALTRVRALARDYAGARQRIHRSNQAYAASSSRKLSQEYAAGLIDRSDMISGRFQLAQITNSSLTLAERQAEFETRAADLEAEAQALSAILSEKGGDDILSYEVLRIKQEYDRSRLETARAIEEREVLRSSLERQEKIVADLDATPYLRALADQAQVAFVPYDNLHNVKVGGPLYRCSLGMVICWKSGKVLAILPGEVTGKHPHRDKTLRGQLVEVQLDGKAAREDVLFVGGKPLWL